MMGKIVTKYATASAQVAAGDVAFTNPGNMVGSAPDGAAGTASLLIGQTTETRRFSGFGFGIPDSALVVAIAPLVVASSDVPLAGLTTLGFATADDAIQSDDIAAAMLSEGRSLITSPTLAEIEASDTRDFSLTWGVGETITGAMLNASGFYVDLAIGSSVPASVAVDAVGLSVIYAAAPVAPATWSDPYSRALETMRELIEEQSEVASIITAARQSIWYDSERPELEKPTAAERPSIQLGTSISGIGTNSLSSGKLRDAMTVTIGQLTNSRNLYAAALPLKWAVARALAVAESQSVADRTRSMHYRTVWAGSRPVYQIRSVGSQVVYPPDFPDLQAGVAGWVSLSSFEIGFAFARGLI